jgi:hypothetical protein
MLWAARANVAKRIKGSDKAEPEARKPTVAKLNWMSRPMPE